MSPAMVGVGDADGAVSPEGLDFFLEIGIFRSFPKVFGYVKSGLGREVAGVF